MKDPHSHAFSVGDRVKILSKAGGCYDGAVGAVTEKLDAGMLPDPSAEIPRFYRVRTDAPVGIGDGATSMEDVHPSGEVFAEGSPIKNYWDICRKEGTR